MKTLRTLWAFLRRDATIHVSYKVGFVMDMGGVFFSAATYYFIAKMFGSAAWPFLKNYGGDYFAFVLIGVAFAAYQNVGLNSFSQSLRQEQFLNTLEPLLMTPVNTPRFLLGSALWDFLYATLRVGVYLALGALIFGLNLRSANVGPALAILVLTLAAFMGLGIFAAAFIMSFKRGNPVTWFMEATSTLLGGVFFPMEALPAGLKKLALLIPMTHALEGLRKTLLVGAGWREVLPQMTALAIFSLVMWPVGVVTFGSALRRAKAEGTLGHY
jgi:ABC-2 type transport system permease protein